MADCAVTLMGFDTLKGETMAMGERTPLAMIDAPASGRMAVGERHQHCGGGYQRDQPNQAFRELDGCGRLSRRDNSVVQTVKAVGMELCPRAWHFDSGGQGFAVDENGVDRWRPGQTKWWRRCHSSFPAFAPVANAGH